MLSFLLFAIRLSFFIQQGVYIHTRNRQVGGWLPSRGSVGALSQNPASGLTNLGVLRWQ